MNNWLSMRLVTPVAVVLACVAFLIWIDQPTFRYALAGNSRVCSVRQLENLPQSVDFIAVGSSRVRRGLDVERLMNESEGLFANAYNLGRPGKSTLRNLRLVRDVLSRPNSIKYLYLEIDVDFLLSNKSDGGLGTFATLTVLPHADLPEVLVRANRNPALGVLFTAGVEYRKIRDSLVALLTGLVWETYTDSDHVAPRVCWSASFDRVATKKIEAIRKGFENRYGDLETATNTRTVTNSFAARQQLRMINEIRQIAKDRGIVLLMSRTGAAYEPPLSEESVASIKKVLPEFVYPPEELVRQTWTYFADAHHYDEQARNLFTDWLMDQFISVEGR
ncbi:MAG: hypothetical protein H6873_01015 [Hyphomicrobiaceae bacterium]|nr:hypothetical protein [Hyphomicrobiaceae bacterium]